MAQFKIKIHSLAALAILSLGACKKEAPAPVTESGVQKIRVFTWSDYIPPSLVKEFESENKAQVDFDYFSSNEELLAKVQANIDSGSQGYDVIFPSDYMAGAMIRMNLLATLDSTKLPVIQEFSEAFKKPPYDPTLSHALPYSWGTTGIAVNTQLAPQVNLSQLNWKKFFEAGGKLKGQTTWLDDVREVLHAALLANGKSWSKANEADVVAAFDFLKKAKKSMKIFTPQAPPVIEKGECSLCMVFSGDALKAGQANKNIVYVIPQEGATLWADNVAIPKNSSHQDLAYKFINKVLAAKSAKLFVEVNFFGTPNAQALDLLDPSLKTLKTLFPPPEVFQKLDYLVDRPELLKTMDKLWTDLKSN